MNAARWAVGMPWRGQDVAYDDATAGQAWRTVWTVGDHDQVAPERAPVIAHRPVAGDVGGSAGADDQSSVLQRRRRPQVAAVLRLQSDAAVVRVGQQRVQIRVQRARCREVVKRGQVSVPPLFGGRQHGMRCGRASAKQVRLIHSKRAVDRQNFLICGWIITSNTCPATRPNMAQKQRRSGWTPFSELSKF